MFNYLSILPLEVPDFWLEVYRPVKFCFCEFMLQIQKVEAEVSELMDIHCEWQINTQVTLISFDRDYEILSVFHFNPDGPRPRVYFHITTPDRGHVLKLIF